MEKYTLQTAHCAVGTSSASKTYIKAINFIDLLFVETSETKRKGRLKLQKTEGWEFLRSEVDQKMKKAPLSIRRDGE